jgi:hypothetical protein
MLCYALLMYLTGEFDRFGPQERALMRTEFRTLLDASQADLLGRLLALHDRLGQHKAVAVR